MEQKERYQSLQKYISADPENIKLLLDLSWSGRDLGDKQFLEYARKAEAIAPDAPEVLFLTGTIALDFSEFEKAITCFKQLLKYSDSEAVRYNLAFAEACANRYDNAYQFLLPIAESMEFFATRFLYAKCLYAASEIESAKKIFHDLLNEQPENIDILGTLALLYSDINSIEKSEEYISRALSLDARAYEARIAQASNKINQFEFGLAHQLFTDIISEKPESGRCVMGLGLIAMGRNDPSLAEPYLRDTVKYMPSHLGSWNALGWCLLVQGKFTDAEEIFRQAIDINGSFAESQGGLACALIFSEKKDEAERYIKLGKRLNPEAFSPRFAELLLNKDKASAEQDMKDLFASSVEVGGPSLQDLLIKFSKKPH